MKKVFRCGGIYLLMVIATFIYFSGISYSGTIHMDADNNSRIDDSFLDLTWHTGIISADGDGTITEYLATAAVGTPGVDTKIPTEKAVRDAIAAVVSNITLSTDLEDNLLGLSDEEITLNDQIANYVFAGPVSGGTDAPRFRALVSADIPDNAANTSGNAATATLATNASALETHAASYFQVALTNPVVQGDFGTNVFTFLGTPTIANLNTAVSDATLEYQAHKDVANGYVGLDATSGITVDRVIIGNPIDTESVETPIQEILFTNDNSDNFIGYSKTVEMTDITDGTEDVSVKEYKMIKGVLTSIGSGFLEDTPQYLTGAGEINITTYCTELTTTSTDAITIANGTYQGQQKFIIMIDDGGDGTLTGANIAITTSIVFDTDYQTLLLEWNMTLSKWVIKAYYGVTIS